MQLPTDVYLLDTNIASDAWDEGSPYHRDVRSRLESLPPSAIFVCVVSLAEIDFGLRSSLKVDTVRQQRERSRMREYELLRIDEGTAPIYADIRARLFQGIAHRTGKRGKFKEKQPDELIDEVTAKLLGIQENDLWIVSVAKQYNYVFCTRDTRPGMRRVIACAGYDKRTQFWELPDPRTVNRGPTK